MKNIIGIVIIIIIIMALPATGHKIRIYKSKSSKVKGTIRIFFIF